MAEERYTYARFWKYALRGRNGNSRLQPATRTFQKNGSTADEDHLRVVMRKDRHPSGSRS